MGIVYGSAVARVGVEPRSTTWSIGKRSACGSLDRVGTSAIPAYSKGAGQRRLHLICFWCNMIDLHLICSSSSLGLQLSICTRQSLRSISGTGKVSFFLGGGLATQRSHQTT